MKSNKKFSAPLGASLVVLSSIFYASYGIWTKLMGNFFDGYTAATLRSAFGVIIVAFIAFFYKKFEPLRLKQNWLHIVGMIVSSLFVWGPLYFAIIHAGVGISLAINYASLVIGMFFFGWLFAKERFTKDKAVSAALGIIGLGLIFSPTFSGLAWFPLSAALMSGFFGAACDVLAKQINYNSIQSTIFLWGTSIVANVLMTLLLSKSYPAFEGQIQWLYLLLFSITSIIASLLLVRGMKLIDAGAAGILGLLEIVFGILFGVAFFNERPTVIALVGMLTIVIAAAIPYYKELK